MASLLYPISWWKRVSIAHFPCFEGRLPLFSLAHTLGKWMCPQQTLWTHNADTHVGYTQTHHILDTQRPPAPPQGQIHINSVMDTHGAHSLPHTDPHLLGTLLALSLYKPHKCSLYQRRKRLWDMTCDIGGEIKTPYESNL